MENSEQRMINLIVSLDADVRDDVIVRTYVDISKKVKGAFEDTVKAVSEDLGLSPDVSAQRVAAIW